MLTTAQQAQVPAVLSSQKTAMTVLLSFDFTPAFELDARLKANKALLDEFIKNPAGVAKREVGMVVPAGFHLHFVDQENNYFPPEGDAVAQLQKGTGGKVWGRVEIRSAVGPGCVTLCGVCGPM
jgi:hypothetical protein